MQHLPVDVVVPCYNPVAGWHRNLVECFQNFQKSIDAPARLILVNDGSTSGVSRNELDYIRNAVDAFHLESYEQNRGKGHALRRGFRQSDAALAITTDIDFPYENESMVRVYEVLAEKGGLILGHRRGDYYNKVPLFRKMLSVSFRAALRLLLNLNVNDTQCGLKGLDKSAKAVFLQTEIPTYLYDLEFVRKINLAGVPIHRVSVELKDSVVFTNMKFSILVAEFRNFLKILTDR